MNPQDTNLSPDPQKHAINNPLSVMQPGEQMICEIKRHPFGIFGIYLGGGALLVVLAILIFGVGPMLLDGDSRSEVYGFGGAIFAFVSLVTLAFVFISQKVYWGNSWVVTTDSVTQITQVSLFSKRSSQLSLGNLEDITAEQNGILAHMFHFGNLKAETAGERSKFVLTYCPNPNDYARKILSAREQFEQRRGGDEQRSYRGPDSYGAAVVPGSAMPQPPGVASYQVPGGDDH